MKINLPVDGEISTYETDEQGRITLGIEYANEKVRLAVLERIDEDENMNLPSEFPRFNWSASDIADDDLKTDRFRELLESSAPHQPYWVGFEPKTGTEVGIEPDAHRRRMLISGGDAHERNSALEIQLRQVIERGYGAIINFSGEGEQHIIDTCARAAGREDIIEINPTQPNPTGFNVIEPHFGGVEYDPENPSHQTAIDAAATVAATLLGRGSGVGAKAMGIIRSVIRFTEGEATLADLYYIFSRQETDILSAERADWWDDMVPADMLGEGDYEHVLRRLQPWIENERIRHAVAAPNPEASLPAAFRDGALLTVCGGRSSGLQDAMITMAALVGSQPTANFSSYDSPLYLITNNVENLASCGPLTNRLSEIRKQNIRFVGACSRLTGWDDATDIIRLCETHLSYSPRNADQRLCSEIHSQNITLRDLNNLPSGVGYLRTAINGTQMESIKTSLPASE